MTAPGTVIAVGEPAPPTTTDKATAALLLGLVPVVLGGVVVVLQNATTLFAGAPAWVFTAAAVLLVILGPVAGYVGAWLTPNRLKVPVQVLAPAVIVADTATPEVPLP